MFVLSRSFFRKKAKNLIKMDMVALIGQVFLPNRSVDRSEREHKKSSSKPKMDIMGVCFFIHNFYPKKCKEVIEYRMSCFRREG